MKKYKELKVVSIPKWGPYLREQWIQSFAGHLTKPEQKAINLDEFLWHLCSWRKVDCVEGENALEAFQKQAKTKCTIFFQHKDEAYLIEKARTITVNHLPYDPSHISDGDLYVMDWDRRWTFMMTHESQCGPYFISLD
ncbi:DUF4275 family protein [Metabacillus malikii]|uniref:DUF4275 family protein n=1 Tax=Metabacillus malikii TaxID=1504265 RepID=A0ABT9ZI39_9BACI|nr:DUF4275 family protein [Metabacillus malikii]MDQ0231645.1 hypothetical protein [Metabacillus malikii]